jgi:hypothetical protein
MIYDSVIWKAELKKQIKSFKKLVDKIDFTTEEWFSYENENGWTKSYKFFIKFQKFCFYSAVISRKFIESNRLSDELKSTSYSVSYFKKRTAEKLTKENFDSIDEEYDTQNPIKSKLTLDKICHLFIHSFIFTPKLIEHTINQNLLDEDIDNWKIDGIAGLYINTDHSKDEKLFYFDLTLIFEIFKNVSEDNIVYIYENRITNEIKRSRKYPKGHKQPKIDL